MIKTLEIGLFIIFFNQFFYFLDKVDPGRQKKQERRAFGPFATLMTIMNNYTKLLVPQRTVTFTAAGCKEQPPSGVSDPILFEYFISGPLAGLNIAIITASAPIMTIIINRNSRICHRRNVYFFMETITAQKSASLFRIILLFRDVVSFFAVECRNVRHFHAVYTQI